MTCGVYIVTNIINNKVYIGKSRNIEKRWSDHKYKPFSNTEFNSCPKFYAAIRKYGLNNFHFEILLETEQTISDIELNKLERDFIKQYNSTEDGYNISEGGDGGWSGDRNSK